MYQCSFSIRAINSRLLLYDGNCNVQLVLISQNNLHRTHTHTHTQMHEANVFNAKLNNE